MARTDEFYDSSRRQLGKPAFVSYWEAWLDERAGMNAALMGAEADPGELAQEGDDLRRRLGDLAKLRAAASRGDSEAVQGILEAMLRYEGTVQSARIRGQATVSSAQIRARETALRNAIRQNEKLNEELGLSAEGGRMLSAMGDGLGGARTAPRTALDAADSAVNAALAEAKATPGSPQHDAIVYRGYQELVAAGHSEAATQLWASRVGAASDPAGYMAERWGMETPAETLQLQREIEKGGVGRADSAGALVEKYQQYQGGGTSGSTRSSVSGVPLQDALNAYMSNPSDTSTLDRLIADTERALKENEAAVAAAREGRSAFAGRFPNYLLSNPFQVVRAESVERMAPVADLARRDPVAVEEVASSLQRTRGPLGGVSPARAEREIASQGGMGAQLEPWAGVADSGPSVMGWAAGRMALAEQQAKNDPTAVRAITDSGGWAYEQGADNSIKITAAPAESAAMIGKTLKKGDKGYDAIVAMYGPYVHPAYAAFVADVEAMPPGLKERLGGIAVLARRDPVRAKEEAMRLAQGDSSTFGQYYAESFGEVARAGDGEGAGVLLESLTRLPADAAGPWSRAYLDSAHRGTFVNDLPRINAAVNQPAPFYENERVRTPDERVASIEAPEFRSTTPPTPSPDAPRLHAYRKELAAAGIENPERDRLAAEALEKNRERTEPAPEPAVEAMGQAYRPARTPAAPAKVEVQRAKPELRIDLGEEKYVAPPAPSTFRIDLEDEVYTAPNSLTGKKQELQALIRSGSTDRARIKQLTDEIRSERDPSLASME